MPPLGAGVYPPDTVTVVVRDGQRYVYNVTRMTAAAILDDLERRGVRPNEIVHTVHSIAAGRFPTPINVVVDHTKGGR